MRTVEFSDPASAELTAAIAWYEQQRSGLGNELLEAISDTINLIRAHPEIGSPRLTRRPSRQLRVDRFPYNVVYRIRDHDIYVIAVAHSSRRPDYWKGRLLIHRTFWRDLGGAASRAGARRREPPQLVPRCRGPS